MFTGWSSTRFVFLALIGNPTWLPEPIMCSTNEHKKYHKLQQKAMKYQVLAWDRHKNVAWLNQLIPLKIKSFTTSIQQ
jgi:hypothetical protein